MTKLEQSSEGAKSRPNIRFIPFAVTELGALGGHATAFLDDLAKHATASKGMHVGKLLVSWRRTVSLAAYVPHAGNVLRGFSAIADYGEATSSCAGVPSHAPCHGPQAFPFFLSRRVRRCLSPPSVAFFALRGSFSCSLIFYVLGLRTM
jgi:hypothetical protein